MAAAEPYPFDRPDRGEAVLSIGGTPAATVARYVGGEPYAVVVNEPGGPSAVREEAHRRAAVRRRRRGGGDGRRCSALRWIRDAWFGNPFRDNVSLGAARPVELAQTVEIGHAAIREVTLPALDQNAAIAAPCP